MDGSRGRVRQGRVRSAIRGRVRALRTRNFRLFFIGQLISNSGNWLTMVALTLLVLHLTGSGVAVGGLVITAGFGWCFTLDAATYLAVLAALWMMRTSELRVVEVMPRGRGQVRAGLRYVRSVPDLRLPFVMLAVVGTMSYNFTVVFPLFVERTLHGNDATYTLVYAVFSAGALLGAFVVADRRTVRIHDVVVGAAGFGLTMLVMAAAPNVAVTLPIV